jgi:hypothetical protein
MKRYLLLAVVALTFAQPILADKTVSYSSGFQGVSLKHPSSWKRQPGDKYGPVVLVNDSLESVIQIVREPRKWPTTDMGITVWEVDAQVGQNLFWSWDDQHRETVLRRCAKEWADEASYGVYAKEVGSDSFVVLTIIYRAGPFYYRATAYLAMGHFQAALAQTLGIFETLRPY